MEFRSWWIRDELASGELLGGFAGSIRGWGYYIRFYFWENCIAIDLMRWDRESMPIELFTFET